MGEYEVQSLAPRKCPISRNFPPSIILRFPNGLFLEALPQGTLMLMSSHQELMLSLS